MDTLIEWFLKDPIKNILVIFGGGGILAVAFTWFSAWFGRRKIQVRVLRETYDPKVDPSSEVVLRFEVTNLGEKPTSLQPIITVTSLTPKAERKTFQLNVQEPDRLLPPHTPKTFNAKAVVNAVYLFCWFKKYQFRITRGSGSIVRHRNAMNEEIGFGRYWFEYFLFRYLKVVFKAA